jgi:glycosyltransferase involved in cell wall biosynthesis
MICRDNENTIGTALKSAAGVFDEIIVVDTGSKDSTLAIVEKYTKKIARITWEDDFAKARNYGLDMATSDLIFYMDSDDELPEETRQAIRIIAEKNDKNVAYQFKIHSIFNDEITKNWINDFDHLKLFPNRKDIRFNNKTAGHLHEGVVDAVLKLPIEIRAVEYFVIHHGYETSDLLEAKINRDIRLCMNLPGRYYQFRIGNYFFSYVNDFLAIWACRKDGNGEFVRVGYREHLSIGNPCMPEQELSGDQLVKIFETAQEMISTYEEETKSTEDLVMSEILRMEKNYDGLRIKDMNTLNGGLRV